MSGLESCDFHFFPPLLSAQGSRSHDDEHAKRENIFCTFIFDRPKNVSGIFRDSVVTISFVTYQHPTHSSVVVLWSSLRLLYDPDLSTNFGHCF